MSERSATQDWQRLAARAVARRTSLGMTQQDVQAAGGPAVATIRHIEGANKTRYRGTILGRLEIALRWTPGSVEQILAGGEPGILAAELGDASLPPLEASLAGRATSDATRRVMSDLRGRAYSENRSLVEVLIEEGFLEPDELIIPDSLPPDRTIKEIIASNIPEETKATLIRLHLENRAKRFEEDRLERKKLDG